MSHQRDLDPTSVPIDSEQNLEHDNVGKARNGHQGPVRGGTIKTNTLYRWIQRPSHMIALHVCSYYTLRPQVQVISTIWSAFGVPVAWTVPAKKKKPITSCRVAQRCCSEQASAS